MSIAATVGRPVVTGFPTCIHDGFVSFEHLRGIDRDFLYYILKFLEGSWSASGQTGSQTNVNTDIVSRTLVTIPADVREQQRIAEALSDADNQIDSLRGIIAKKQAVKTGLMQQLLTGRTRLPGFTASWATVSLGEAAAILDNLRVPLSADERAERRGPYPYCGANGVLDSIDDFMIDDDVILLAEDGGNFDQWRTRPIAYRMSGKIWVNNHAHVLKGGANFDTGFLFYALEHKDITPYISSGTRSKLTRGELVRIAVDAPHNLGEQRAIASVMEDADYEIRLLHKRLVKARNLRQGVMQELLTGRARLPLVEGAA